MSHQWQSQGGWVHPEGESLAVNFKCLLCGVAAQFDHGLDEPDESAAGECEGLPLTLEDKNPDGGPTEKGAP